MELFKNIIDAYLKAEDRYKKRGDDIARFQARALLDVLTTSGYYVQEETDDAGKVTGIKITKDGNEWSYQVYVPVTLTIADTRIDKDYERFTFEALHQLADMFIGKRGELKVKRDGRYETIKAEIVDTYIDDDNGVEVLKADVVLEPSVLANEGKFDNTQVSISCSCKRRCSICKKDNCEHIHGLEYYGEKCVNELYEALDAYEFFGM